MSANGTTHSTLVAFNTALADFHLILFYMPSYTTSLIFANRCGYHWWSLQDTLLLLLLLLMMMMMVLLLLVTHYLMAEKLSKVWLCCSTEIDDGWSRIQHFISISGIFGEFLVQCQLTDLGQSLLLFLVEVRRCFRKPDASHQCQHNSTTFSERAVLQRHIRMRGATSCHNTVNRNWLHK